MISHEVARGADGVLELKLAGKIDEQFESDDLVSTVPGGRPVRLHLGGVRSISSLGIRSFEVLIERLQSTGSAVELVHLSPALATQLTLIPNLCAGAKVTSAELPFLCNSCSHEQRGLVPWAYGAHTAHAPSCSACGARMVLDGMADQYLPPEA
jgi:anti-anti-sigma regulatory factor